MENIKEKDIFAGEEFSSNAVRLTSREIIAAAVMVVVALFLLFPMTWRKLEPFDYGKNFRIAEKYRDDYWAFQSWADAACKKYPVIFLGDSVIWGMYSDNESSLPTKINAAVGMDIAANLAIDGLHSLALKGLLENYATGIKNKTVVLHFNPLWLNSPEYDLSGMEPARPHHPRLLPQFIGKPKSYDEDFCARMDVVKEKTVPFFSLLNHIRLVYFGNSDFKEWMTEHPYSNPVKELLKKVDYCEREKNKNSVVCWEQNNITKQNWTWIPLEQSRQWSAFLEVLALLKKNGNKVMVLAGPINKHMLTDESRAQYEQLQRAITEALKNQGVPCVLAPDMPSEVYADASHPLEKGYSIIAAALIKTGVFDEAARQAISRRVALNVK